MPCSQRKARILLKEGKAVINKYNPFTIQLTYATGETKQECHIGVDTGAKHMVTLQVLLLVVHTSKIKMMNISLCQVNHITK